MQFKHPEFLYALLFLLIPIVVHLFQLHKYKKVYFSNVNTLKSIKQQSRKSAIIKKWLILLLRLGLITTLVLAFSEPYLSNFNEKTTKHTILFVDNSYSMQAEGANGELLKDATNTLVKNIDKLAEETTLITTDGIFQNLSKESLKNKLLSLQYTSASTSLKEVLFTIQNVQSEHKNEYVETILLSDFQSNTIESTIDSSLLSMPFEIVPLLPKKTPNVYVDSVYVSENSNEFILLNVIVKNSEKTNQNYSISLIHESTLAGKSSVNFSDNTTKEIQFKIPYTTNFNGRIYMQDNALLFDNSFYFTISNPTKINVLIIGKKAPFLERIYTKNEFILKHVTPTNIDFSSLQQQHIIVLNEMAKFDNAFQNEIQLYVEKGGSLVIIPAKNIDLKSYNNFLEKIHTSKITSATDKTLLISSINTNHPVFRNVFEKQISNFQYPQSNWSYNFERKSNSSILSYNSNSSFVKESDYKNGLVYIFSSPLDIAYSNFIESPLVVPLFYNIAMRGLPSNSLYTRIKKDTEIRIGIPLQSDEVIALVSKNESFIPIQKPQNQSVIISFTDTQVSQGFYTIKQKNTPLGTIALNVSTSESNSTYITEDELKRIFKNARLYSSTEKLLDELSNERQINWLFKWFLTFSIVFLLLEMLILKYFKI